MLCAESTQRKMATLSETAETKRRYLELLSSLSESLPCLAEQVDGLADRMLPGLCPRDQLDWLDVLAGEVSKVEVCCSYRTYFTAM